MKLSATILLLLLFSVNALFGISKKKYGEKIDSLKRIISSYTHDSLKVKAYFEWDDIIYIEDLELDYSINQKIASICKANIERLQSANRNSSELSFFKYSIVKTYNNRGLYFIEKNKPYDALILFEEGYKIASEYHFKDLLSSITNNIGLIYDFINDYKKALEYFLKSLEFENDSISSAPAFNNIGLCYFKLENVENAIPYYYKSIHFSLISNDNKNLGNTYSNLSDVYSKLNITDSVYYYLSKAFEIYNLTSNKQGIAYIYNNFGELYLNKNDFKNAIIYCHKSLEIAKEMDFLSISTSSCKCLYKSYKQLNKVDSAFYYLEKYIEEGDKYTLEKSNSELLKKQFQFEFDAKQKLAAAEHKKEIELFEERQKRQNAIVIFSIIGILGLIIFLFLIYKSLKEYKRQNKVINEQKVIVETKQKEILDSIHYAKRIQMALLTSEFYIEKQLKRLKK